MVWSQQGGDRIPVSPHDFVEWRRRATAFTALEAWGGRGVNIAGRDLSEPINAPTLVDLSGSITAEQLRRATETLQALASRVDARDSEGQSVAQNTETGLAAGFTPASRRKWGDRHIGSPPGINRRASARGNA